VTEIQQNRWDQLVRRVANIVAPGSMVSDSLNELFPTLNVETLVAELQLLKGTRIAFGSLNHPASAGDLNHVQVFNPVDSGMIVTVDMVNIRASAVQEIRYAIVSTALADSTGNPTIRDTRVPAFLPSAELRSVQQVGGIPLQGSYLVGANITRTLKNDFGLFVLSPGFGIQFATTLANTASIFSFFWRERTAEPAELNF